MCSEAIKLHNKALKKIRKTMAYGDFIEYKRKLAIVRNVIKEAKRYYWRQYCESIGEETEIGSVWGMIKKIIAFQLL